MKLPNDFDWKSYLNLNPKLRAAGLKNERQARYHYFHYGQKLGYQYSRKEIEKTKQVDTISSTTYIVLDDLELLLKTIDDHKNNENIYEILFGFSNFSEESINHLKSLQETNKFLHCYGFNSETVNKLEYLKFLCLYPNVIVYPSMERIIKENIPSNDFDINSFYSLRKINFGILTASWQRKKLTSKYCEHIDYLKQKFSNH